MKFNNLNFNATAGLTLLLAAGASFCVLPRAAKPTAVGVASAEKARPRAVDGYGRLPLSFEVNRGQTDASVRFLARGQGYTLFLTSKEAVLSLQKPARDSQKGGRLENPGAELVADRFALFNDRWPRAAEVPESQSGDVATNTVLQMRLVGASSNAKVKGAEELPGKSNYFIGNNPKQWRTHIPTYAKVRIGNVYPGVDLVYYGNQGQLEYDFVVRPGADPSVIKLALTSGPSVKGKDSSDSTDGASMKVDSKGDVLVLADGGEVRFCKPVIYQPASEERGRPTAEKKLVAGRYSINEQNEVEFIIGEYDRTQPLIIDPVLAYSTYLGGSGWNAGYALAVDSSGNAYVTGLTNPTNSFFGQMLPFPTSANAFQHAYGGNEDAFVTKLNSDGSALIYSTYLGGSGADFGNGIAVDGSGNALLTGFTTSNDFPTVRPLQASNRGYPYNASAFVTKLNSDGSALVYSTYLGGSQAPPASAGDGGTAITVDSSGNAYVTGYATSKDFPISANAFQLANHSSYTNAFVTKLNGDGSALVYSTYLGGSGSPCSGCGTIGDLGNSIVVDSSGSAYVTGQTWSTDFPTASAIQATNHSSYSNAFVTKLNVDGSALIYSTYLGGSGPYDSGHGIAVDSSGNAYVTGETWSTDFPTASALFSATRGLPDTFVVKLNAPGSAFVYSTYLGGGGRDAGWSIAVDDSGNSYVTGLTGSSDFPTANPIQGTYGGGVTDAFATELNANATALVYSTYLGGSQEDQGRGIAVDHLGNAYVTGVTFSSNFPADSPPQPANLGNDNAFVLKISPLNLAIPTPP